MYHHLSVDGLGIADEIPGLVFPVIGMPKLTTRMVARFATYRATRGRPSRVFGTDASPSVSESTRWWPPIPEVTQDGLT